jgi:CheY-like chemotaxis protein
MALADPDRKTVLIADDDDWTREMLALLLEDEGLVPLEAGTGPETIDVASAHRPDCHPARYLHARQVRAGRP